jgi:hypothetical protein
MTVIEVDAETDTVYIQHRQAVTVPLGRPLYDTIDWLQLAKQKMELLLLTTRQREEEFRIGAPLGYPLDGIVNLIDTIQDDAEAQGYPIVWAYNAQEWRNGELEFSENE